MPNVVGLTQTEAETALFSAGLTVGVATTEYDDIVPAGRVIRPNPTAGASVLPGAAVALVLSNGPPPIRIQSILIQPDAPRLLTGQTQTFTAIGILSDGASQNLAGQVTWSSSNPAVASVNAGGTVTALTEGATTLQATKGNVNGSATLTQGNRIQK